VALVENVSRSVIKAFKVVCNLECLQKGLLTNRRSVQCDIGTAVLFLEDMLGVLGLVLRLERVLVIVLVLEMILGMVLGLLLLLWIESRHLRITDRTDIEGG
jgi:hypothetical protein